MHLTTIEENNIWTIDNFLTSEECDKWITFTDDKGFEVKYNSEVRYNGRLTIDQESEVTPMSQRELFSRLEILNFLPSNATDLYKQESATGYTLQNTAPMLRFYKYVSSEHFFKPHYDYSNITYPTVKKEGIKTTFKSFVTLLVYLTTVNDGGETVFFDDGPNSDINNLVTRFKVKPKQGQALLFVHDNLHEGAALAENTTEKKYVLRTDIVYRKSKTMKEKKVKETAREDLVHEDLSAFV
jgi:hypothetical protein